MPQAVKDADTSNVLQPIETHNASGTMIRLKDSDDILGFVPNVEPNIVADRIISVSGM